MNIWIYRWNTRTKYLDENSGGCRRRRLEEGGCCSLGSLLRPPVASSVVWAASWLASNGFAQKPTADATHGHIGENSTKFFPVRRKPNTLDNTLPGKKSGAQRKTLHWQNREGSLSLLKLGEKFGEVAQTLLCFTKTTSPYHQLWGIPIGDAIQPRNSRRKGF